MMLRRRAQALATLALALALALAGCATRANQSGLQEENQRLTAEIQRLKGENAKLATEKSDLSTRLGSVGKETDRLRDLSARLEAELQAKDRSRCAIPASLVSPHYLNVPGLDSPLAYRKLLTADLDGDGAAERVTMVTNAGADPKTGEFGWDDGHPWQVYVDEPDGTRTILFAQWVQLGRMKLLLGEAGRLIIQSEQGAGTVIYEITYRGPNRVEAVQLVSFQVLDRAAFPQGSNFRE